MRYPKKNSKKSPTHRKSPTTVAQQKRSAKKSPSQKIASREKKAHEEAVISSSVQGASTVRVDRLSPIVDIGRIWEGIGVARPVEFRISFVRPDDLLVCDFIFDNLKLEGKKLVRKNTNAPATLIVELPPQSFGEQAFLDATGPEAPSNPPVNAEFPETAENLLPPVSPDNVAVPKAEDLGTFPFESGALPFAKMRMAGRSRIAFAMPADVTELDFTLDAILDVCRRWPMQLDVCAKPEPLSFPDDALKGRHYFDKEWLQAATVSTAWNQVTETLFGLLSKPAQPGKVQRQLTAVGEQIAYQAATAINSGRTSHLASELTISMNRELDSLASEFPQFREDRQREYALAALSLISTQAFAAGDARTFDIGYIEVLPFLPIFFWPHKPPPTVTALELPYRMILSPIAPIEGEEGKKKINWWHAKQPVVHNGRTELWHTRLTQTTDGIGTDPSTKVRAIWSPDYELENDEIIRVVNNNKPFRMSLDALDRQMLVKLMAGFDERDPDGRQFTPRASNSRRLTLSALGALLDAEGNWNIKPKYVGLEQWRHRASLGRDHYVKVVYEGFLCPFCHSASLIKITERKFESAKKARVAVLRQRFFIVVREKIKTYNGAGHVFAGRNFPFTSVEIITDDTPNLLAPDHTGSQLSDPTGLIYNSAAGVPHRACFWPMIGVNRNFLFQIRATDFCGNQVTFTMPLLFIGNEANQKADPNTYDVMDEIIKRYKLEPKSPRRTTSLGNAVICFAPPKPGSEGSPTIHMTFGVGEVTGLSLTKAQFYPEMEEAKAGIAAMQRLLGKPDAVVSVTYPDRYKQAGFGSTNPGELYLQTIQPYKLVFGDKVKSDALGGLATPSMEIQGLSRVMGPVAGSLGEIINNNFNPGDFFKGAKILGGVDLAAILGLLPKPLAGGNVPKLLSKQLLDKIEARFDWMTDINDSDPAGLFVPKAGGKQTVLEMHGVVTSPIDDASQTTFNAEATIVNFKINLFGFITIWFDRLRFFSTTGSKPDVSVDLHPGDQMIEFGGPLEFVNQLRSIIPSNGFSDPPGISITPSGISASYSLSIPSVAVGIFALEHVSIGAGFALPFDAKPVEVRFNFSERQRPFSLTVSLLGGGGFFAIGIGTDGVREIEAALEFGAALSINLGVASGSVEIKAGVYFHWMQTSVELAGYVRLHGELSVLGIFSASLTFNLQLAFLKETGHSVVWGEATLTVEIELLCFSKSVSVKCRREFGGSEADPKFIELITNQATWTEYCRAFGGEV